MRRLRCVLLRHPWRWSPLREYLLHGVSYRVCDVCERYRKAPLSEQFKMEWMAFGVGAVLWAAFVVGAAASGWWK